MYVFYGSTTGLSAENHSLIGPAADYAACCSQDSVDDAALFGWSVVIANFDGTGGKELLAGMPGFDLDLGGPDDIGATSELHHLPAAATMDHDLFFSSRGWCDSEGCHAGAFNLTGTDGDRLGESLSAWDLNGDGKADQIVGVPGDDFTLGSQHVTDAGVVHVVYSGVRQEHLYQGGPIGSTGGLLQGTAESGDEFGSALY